MGPLEQKVRDSLKSRAAGVLDAISGPVGAFERADNVFAALFNGATSEGTFWPNGRLFIGKAEAEWGWPAQWEKLRDAGLIEYELYETPNHPSFGGTTTKLRWSITDKGWEVRNDDLAYFREVMAARDQDEAAGRA